MLQAPCPCCGSFSMSKVQEMRDMRGRILPIMECRGCSSYINISDLEQAVRNPNITQVQADRSDDFYLAKTADAQNEIKLWTGMLSDLLSRTTSGRAAMLDFGAGMGYSASAGTHHFQEVFAIEPSRNMLSASHPRLPNNNRIRICDTLADVPARMDAIIIWHVLEHLPFLLTDFRKLADLLADKGAIFFQVPMFQQSHLVDCHYTFLNDRSARTLCEAAGLRVNDILYDHTLNFLTCIAIKDAT